MSRSREIRDVAPDRQAEWLAGQLDEIEARLDKLQVQMSDGFARIDEQMAASRRVLTGILVAIIVALVALPVGLLLTLLSPR